MTDADRTADLTQAVYKYPLALADDPTKLALPIGAVPLFVATQGPGALFLWARVSPRARNTTTRVFHVVGTGHGVDPLWHYVGSCQDRGFVWHVFEAK